MKVHIKNYQAIKDALLEFEPGITAIIGPTNSGKSSIIRAIEGAINNRPGNSFINYEADFCEVLIEDLGHSITWKKSKKGNSSYMIDGKELLKIGKSQIDEVGETLNMPEVIIDDSKFRLNFWKQMTPPFLVDKTSYQLFGFISQSKEQELITSYQDSLQSDIKSIDKEITILNAQVDTRTKDELRYIELLKNLESISEYNLDMLEKALALRDTVNSLVISYKELSEEVDNQAAIFNNLSKNMPELNLKMTSIEDTIRLNKDISSVILQYDTANSNYSINKITHDSLEKSIDNMSTKLSVIESRIDEIKDLEVNVKNIFNSIKSYDLAVASILSINKDIERYTKLQDDTMKEIGEFSMCPMCGQSIESHKHD